MTEDTSALRDFYATNGIVCDPGAAASLLDGVPSTVEGLAALVQGVMLHVQWAPQYGVTVDDGRRAEVGLRTVDRILHRLVELDDRPLTRPRPPERRVVGTCRDFSVLLAALLHHHGVPARVRSGFGTYLSEDQFEGHWVTEVWRADRRRWALVDAQLDEVQREAFGIAFDPLDVPRDRFLLAGQAWRACRDGAAYPDQFGVFDVTGEAFIARSVVRDFLALNKVEILPWDGWELMPPLECDDVPEPDRAFIDELAELTTSGDAAWEQIRSLFVREPRLSTLPQWVTAP